MMILVCKYIHISVSSANTKAKCMEMCDYLPTNANVYFADVVFRQTALEINICSLDENMRLPTVLGSLVHHV